MSGPVRLRDAGTEPAHGHPEPPAVELTPSHAAEVGGMPVRRALPRRARRTVGPWCFVDHLGPMALARDEAPDVGPHPHIGLQTVTWLLAGEIVHRDSLGSEQAIRPGQLNLMTSGRGIAHAEEGVRGHAEVHGVQLWVAQPEATRHGAPGFEHHAALPQVEVGDAVATVLVGDLDGTASPARRDTDHVGVDLTIRSGRADVPVRPEHEHALVVLDGSVRVGGSSVVEPGHLAYLGLGRDGVQLEAGRDARVLLLGGVPFEADVVMWWNFVARTREEIEAARTDWEAGSDRFGETGSHLDRIPAPPTPWP